MMSAETLLTRLDAVRQTSHGRWVARCPAHSDHSPSLAIRELNDGRVLLHDFAGCAVEEILAAVGLQLSDLFPPREIEHAPRERRPFIPQDVFQIARQEISVAAIIAADLRKQRTVSEADYHRLFVCVERLNGIAEGAYARP